MAKTVCQVEDDETAVALRDAALAAGMVARIDQATTGMQVTIDHPEERRPSAEHLVLIHGPTGLATSQWNAPQFSRLVSVDIATGMVAEERNISIDDARVWMQDAADQADVSILAIAQSIIHGQSQGPA